jgi:Bifunctional DNA primase/polymerase, N-terminal
MSNDILSGLPRFPCALDKSPLTSNGFYNAVVNVNDSGWPLVGVRTGRLSGVAVLDVDPEGLAWLDANRARLPMTREHWTPRGRHLLFVHVEGMRNSTKRISPGVQVRAEGGYVIWWPARGYGVANGDRLAEWPEWLLELAMAPPRKVPIVDGCRGLLSRDHVCASAIGGIEGPLVPEAGTKAAILALLGIEPTQKFKARLDQVQRAVESAPVGNRNSCLHWAACTYAEMILDSELGSGIDRWPPENAMMLLMSAAHTNGLVKEDGREACKATILSGFRHVRAKALEALEAHGLRDTWWYRAVRGMLRGVLPADPHTAPCSHTGPC